MSLAFFRFQAQLNIHKLFYGQLSFTALGMPVAQISKGPPSAKRQLIPQYLAFGMF